MTAIPPETTVEQALRTLAGLEIACVLVAREGRLLGLFSERDVLDKVAERYEELKDKPITEVMTPDPVYVYESDRAGKALCVMAVSGYRHVPVVDVNERILGIVSPLRVMRFLQSRCEGR
ncbi:MAG: CBS domain-containing protein [Planctomycetota bacterium]|nr:CBS domain-containing protein [Planctomycetota bacterium]